MAQLPGLFESFDNLDTIEASSLITWLKNPPTEVQLENYLANRILYPQTLPLTDVDMKFDLAILREALRINGPKSGVKEGPLLGGNSFINITLRKIIIPDRFLNNIPSPIDLTWAFVDGLLLNRRKEDWFEDFWTVILADDIDEVLGTVLLPQFGSDADTMNLNLLGKDYKIKAGSLTVVSCPKDRCQIAYKFLTGKVLGKKESTVEVYGGKLGLMIDGRMK